MSSVNYSLNNRGVRLIGTPEAWVKTKNVWHALSLRERLIRKNKYQVFRFKYQDCGFVKKN